MNSIFLLSESLLIRDLVQEHLGDLVPDDVEVCAVSGDRFAAELGSTRVYFQVIANLRSLYSDREIAKIAKKAQVASDRIAALEIEYSGDLINQVLLRLAEEYPTMLVDLDNGRIDSAETVGQLVRTKPRYRIHP